MKKIYSRENQNEGQEFHSSCLMEIYFKGDINSLTIFAKILKANFPQKTVTHNNLFHGIQNDKAKISLLLLKGIYPRRDEEMSGLKDE